MSVWGTWNPPEPKEGDVDTKSVGEEEKAGTCPDQDGNRTGKTYLGSFL